MIWDNDTQNFLLGDPTGMQFKIIFYADNSGAPGAIAAQFSNISPALEHYSTYYSENIGYPAFRFDVAGLHLPAGLNKGWVSIQSTYSPGHSQFFMAYFRHR